MAALEPEVAGALNTLLEDERASVEIEVALASGATEYLEREALTAMGTEDTGACVLLREHLDRGGVPVTRRINGIVLQALNLDRYDDRLRLFVAHQRDSAARAAELLEREGLGVATRQLLEFIINAHTRHALWCEQRAAEFAATRDLEFTTPSGPLAQRSRKMAEALLEQTAETGATPTEHLEESGEEPAGGANGSTSAPPDTQGEGRDAATDGTADAARGGARDGADDGVEDTTPHEHTVE